MRQAIFFTLAFVALTIFLTWLWLAGGNQLYAEAIEPLAREIYRAFGVTGRGTLLRTRFINIVPFTALMLLTPRLTPRKRFLGLVVGWGVLILSHIALNGFAMMSRSTGRLPPVAALASDAMPFLLWFVFARDFVAETMQAARRPDAAKDGSRKGIPDPDRPAQPGDEG